MPKILNEKEEPIDAADIRKILLSCNNRRLKTYLLVLASGGSRAVEGCAIRIKDINLKAVQPRYTYVLNIPKLELEGIYIFQMRRPRILSSG